jgi:hypothetical protein
MWEIDSLRGEIVTLLSRITQPIIGPAEQIKIARAYGIPNWVKHGLKRLVLRPEPMTAQEMELVGVAVAAQIWALRDKHRSSLVHSSRVDAYQKLFNAWVPHCRCKACDHGREVTMVGGTKKEVVSLDYSSMTPETEDEIQKVEAGFSL